MSLKCFLSVCGDSLKDSIVTATGSPGPVYGIDYSQNNCMIIAMGNCTDGDISK